MNDYRINQTSEHFAKIHTKKLNCPYQKNNCNIDSFIDGVPIPIALISPLGRMGLSRLVACLLSRANSASWNSLITQSVSCLGNSKRLVAAD